VQLKQLNLIIDAIRPNSIPNRCLCCARWPRQFYTVSMLIWSFAAVRAGGV